MQTEILMIGTELLLGQIVDTNAAFIGRTLAEHGINLYQKTTVGDNAQRIMRALDGALSRCDVVLLSGGLGPTEDDITRESVAELLGRPLEFRQDLLAQLEERFRNMGRPLGENNRKQAYAPRGAVAIPNPNGTAPGFIVEDDRGVVIAMPGVPRELEAMLADSVIPYLRRRFTLSGLLHYRVLKVCGMGESRVDELIGDLITTKHNPTVGLLASADAVRIRIAARAADIELAGRMILEVEEDIRSRLPGLIMGADDDTLEGVVDGLLRAKGWTLALGETATGGAIAQRLTAASAGSFVGGLVVPSRGDAPGGAPDEARRLAETVRAQFHADCAFAAVPEAAERRSAAVFLTPEAEHEWEIRFAPTAQMGQLRTAVLALEHIRRLLSGMPDPWVEMR